MKWALLAILTLGALGAWAMGLQAAGSLSSEVKTLPLPTVVMRPLPPLQGGPAIAVAAPAAAPTPPAEPPKPEAAPKPEPEVAAAPKPEPAKPVAMAQPKPSPAPKPPPSEDAPPPLPKPAPPLKPQSDQGSSPPPAAAPQGEGIINLKASDTAEVVIDGRKVGPSPKLGVKLKAGRHKVRFDCYDENGNLKPGNVQTVEIKPDEASDIDYECPFSQ